MSFLVEYREFIHMLSHANHIINVAIFIYLIIFISKVKNRGEDDNDEFVNKSKIPTYITLVSLIVLNLIFFGIYFICFGSSPICTRKNISLYDY